MHTSNNAMVVYAAEQHGGRRRLSIAEFKDLMTDPDVRAAPETIGEGQYIDSPLSHDPAAAAALATRAMGSGRRTSNTRG